MAEDSHTSADALIARAFDRALDAERAAQAAIAACERETAERLEQARQQRRSILERAQARIVALHTRMALALQTRSAQILESRQRAAALDVERLADPRLRAVALERLAARLTSSSIHDT